MGNNTNTNKNLQTGQFKVLKHVMPSAADAEIGADFIDAKEGSVLCTTLKELGHKQPPRTYGNRQYHCHRIQQWHNKTKTHKSHGNKANLMYTGAHALKIWQFISQNIIRLRIIKECERYTSTPTNNRCIRK
jgi:hypothetical protein